MDPATGAYDQAWIVFLVVFVGLGFFDLHFLAPHVAVIDVDTPVSSSSAKTAFLQTAFWFVIGIAFNAGVYAAFGSELAVPWYNGYILEYLLSIDNVFIFHVVFKSYKTPPSQIHKALYLGILAAIGLRLICYVVGAQFFRSAFVFQVFFGFILIYSGYWTAVSTEDDEDPRDNWCVKFITQTGLFTDTYDDTCCLFTRLAVSDDVLGLPGHKKKVLRGTLLLLVVCVLGAVDLIFAVDSVAAKIAEFDDTFVNFSSSAFAMLCLRSMYFVLAELLKYCRFLKFGVALVLVMIGAKIIANPWVQISSFHSAMAICIVFAASIVFSIIIPSSSEHQRKPELQGELQGEELEGLLDQFDD